MSTADLTPARQTFRLSVPSGPTAPRTAREVVALLLVLAGHGPCAATAKVLVSEVVTNVHLHTITPVVDLDVEVGPGGVSVGVWDDEPQGRNEFHEDTADGGPHDAVRGDAVRGDGVGSDGVGSDAARADDERGRGLVLVDALSTAWGITRPGAPADPRKRVWFSLSGIDLTGADLVEAGPSSG
ncbi:hypothetical protein ACPXCE_26190 [Streptomyces sp. DT24]|uniref:hypothetical protein n=1 Tax=Streptomyces sp. DT24 TaxID=3416520 RepID=UPI003CF78EDA